MMLSSCVQVCSEHIAHMVSLLSRVLSPNIARQEHVPCQGFEGTQPAMSEFEGCEPAMSGL